MRRLAPRAAPFPRPRGGGGGPWIRRGEADDAFIDFPAEEQSKAIDGAARLGEVRVQRIELLAVAAVERIETRVEAGERLAVRGQDQEVIRQVLSSR
jgi:hypothetical protein